MNKFGANKHQAITESSGERTKKKSGKTVQVDGFRMQEQAIAQEARKEVMLAYRVKDPSCLPDR